ncbi:MAG: arsenate reductase family protein [Clostridiaceae bacterium]|nr:arsenate reductase family protein [Clostridiaceae bacterium]
MLFVCYTKCTTCHKAQTFLDARGVKYVFRDIRSDNPTEAEIRDWHIKSGLPLRRFFNTSGLQYKALGLSAKLSSMSEAEQYRLLASDGMLVKRPILVLGDQVLIGFRQPEWEVLLPSSGAAAAK